MKDKRIRRASYICIFVIVLLLIVNSRITTGEKPVIQVGSTRVAFTKGMDTKQLLKGVVATDKEDGDITDSVIIENVVYFDNNSKVKVIYAVCDSDNNVTKSAKVIKCSGNNASDDAEDDIENEED